MRRRPRGFTLAELTVMCMVFTIFAMTAVAVMTLAMQYWTQSNQRVLAEQNARVAISTISSELRQGIPDPDPGSGNPATGYLSITPTVSPTAVLVPNANSTTGTSLEFTETNPTNYDPSSGTFSSTNPANYQRVRYYVSGTDLHRELKLFDATGTVTSTSDDVIVSASSTGTLILSTQYLNTNEFKLTVTAAEGISQFVLSTTVTALGE